jgi:hypothetical protein
MFIPSPAIVPGQNEGTNMNTNIITAAVFALALAPSVAAAGHSNTAADGETLAVEVCQGFNAYGPAEVLTVVDDGMGDYLIWLEDVDGDFWACNANADGDIYANVLVTFDLLDGEGPDMLHLVAGGQSRDPAKMAERLCIAAADDKVKVVATVEDGLGDYLVWLKASDETFIMCNASTDGQLWAFEPVNMPINDQPAMTSEAPAGPISPAPVRPGLPSQFG